MILEFRKSKSLMTARHISHQNAIPSTNIKGGTAGHPAQIKREETFRFN